jgi:error-prone DNA polymerase
VGNRRIIYAAHMLLIDGKVQREGQVVHLVVQKLTDLSERLAAISEEEAPVPLPYGRGDEFHHGGGGSPDSRHRSKRQARDISISDLHIDSLTLKPRNFR